MAMGEAARAFAVGRDWSRELDELEAAYAEAQMHEGRRDGPERLAHDHVRDVVHPEIDP